MGGKVGDTGGFVLLGELGIGLTDGLGAVRGFALGATVAAGLACTGSAFFFSPKMLGLPSSNIPAIQAIIIVANVPTNRAFQPKSEMSLRRDGISAIVPPTKIPTEAR